MSCQVHRVRLIAFNNFKKYSTYAFCLSDPQLARPCDGGDVRAVAPAPRPRRQADVRPRGDLGEEALLLRRPLRPRQQPGRHQHVQGTRVYHLQESNVSCNE